MRCWELRFPQTFSLVAHAPADTLPVRVYGPERTEVRREAGAKDAITAATVLNFDVPLVPRNISDFDAIEGLALRNPFED